MGQPLAIRIQKSGIEWFALQFEITRQPSLCWAWTTPLSFFFNDRLIEVADQDAQSEAARIRMWKRLVFWDFPRASWQYDLVVALILVFIFLTPGKLFHDQPRASSVVFLSAERGLNRVFIEADLLNELSENERLKRSQELIQQRTGKLHKVVRVEPIRDETEKEIKGFIAYTTP